MTCPRCQSDRARPLLGHINQQYCPHCLYITHAEEVKTLSEDKTEYVTTAPPSEIVDALARDLEKIRQAPPYNRMTSAEKSDHIWKLEQALRNQSELNDRLQAKCREISEKGLEQMEGRVRAALAEMRGFADWAHEKSLLYVSDATMHLSANADRCIEWLSSLGEHAGSRPIYRPGRPAC